MAIGSQPSHLLRGVIHEGALMAFGGVLAGAICGFALARTAGTYLAEVKTPGPVPVVGAALLLLVAAVAASMVPAVRAARVDVMQALRTE